ncbi:MAG: OmpA family protein [Alphaproteobacteria bacterium]|nr:OmpA family protein [Alphaproteobacteria bacterium]
MLRRLVQFSVGAQAPFGQAFAGACWYLLTCFLVFSVSTVGQAADDQFPNRAAHPGPANEAVLGTFHLNGRLNGNGPITSEGGTGAGPENPDAARERPRATSRQLVEMFADARAALESGDDDRARQLFEQLIAAKPDGRLADESRAHLGQLYRGRKARQATRRHTRPQPKTSGVEPHQGSRREKTYGPLRPEREKEMHQRALRARQLAMMERQFIADVGDRVFFSVGSHRLGARARDVLQAQARWLNAHPTLSANITGHADDGRLSPEAQETLSYDRARIVRDRLIEEGVASSRLQLVGVGRAQPIADCPDATCSAQNRRVVTVIGYKTDIASDSSAEPGVDSRSQPSTVR